MIGDAGSDLALPALSQSTFRKPQISGERDTKNQKQKTDMKKLIMKLLGLETLVAEVAELKAYQKDLTMAQEGLSAKVDEVSEKVDEIEIPDFDADDFVREDDVNDRIESYLNDNDYVTQSYCDDEIESKVSDAIENEDIQSKIDEAIEGLDLDSKPASTGEQDIETKVSEAIKVTLEKMVKALADQQG